MNERVRIRVTQTYLGSGGQKGGGGGGSTRQINTKDMRMGAVYLVRFNNINTFKDNTNIFNKVSFCAQAPNLLFKSHGISQLTCAQ